MVDLSNLTQEDIAAEDARIGASAPAASGVTPGFGEGLAATWDELKYYSDLRAGYSAQRDFIQQSLDAYKNQYGEALPNPMDWADADRQASTFAHVRQHFADRAAQEPTAAPDAAQFGGMKPALAFPNDDDIVAGGRALSQRALGRAADVAANGGPLEMLGALTANIADGITSPLNAAAIAAIPEVSLPLRALVAAGAFGAAQAVQEGATIGYKQEVNPDFKVDDAIANIKDAALGGAAFEVGGALGVKVLGAAWRRVFGVDPAKAAALPLPVHDAGVVAERASDLDANNPFRTGVTGEAAHSEAVATIDTQIANGDKPELPASAQTELQARTGDVFAGPTQAAEVIEPAKGFVEARGGGSLTVPSEPGMAKTALDDYVRAGWLSRADADVEFRRVIDTYRLNTAEDAWARSPSAPVQAPNPAGNLPASLPAPAADAPAFYGSGRSVRVKYELAEARALVTSHDDGFHANPNYPAELQPRNRGGKPAREQVFEILNRLDPERLGPNVEANSGAPIIGPDNIVESGNGRSMALRMAYARDGAPGYRAFLERQGFDTSGFKEPVLVGRRVSPMDDAEREAFAQAANGSASLRMTPAEQAMADARHLTADVTALAKSGEVTSAANRDFVRAFGARLPQGERGGMLTAEGSLSAAGVNRLRAAMVARAYGDPAVVARMFDHPDPNIKTIASALTSSTAEWVRMRDAATAGLIPPTQDITDAVMTAVKAVMRARDAGRPVGEILAQGDMFTSDIASLAARLFFKDDGTTRFLSKADMATNLANYAEGLRTGAERGADIFGAAPRTAEEVLKDTIAASDRRVASLIEASKSSDAIAKALADPKVEESMFAQLERNIGSGNNKFVSEDAEGNARVVFADPELLAIQQQEALAKEISGCIVPIAAE